MSELCIVGGGPAGLTAAIYARRAGKNVTVFEKESLGGQIVSSPLVENYPGIAHIRGADFAALLSDQAEALGTEIRFEEVLRLRKEASGFTLETAGGSCRADAVILATGVTHRGLGLPGEEELVGAGLSFCAVCDGAFCAGQDVAVIGGGDTALQDALFLAGTSRLVYLIHRRDAFRAEARLVERAMNTPNIVILTDTVPVEYLQEDGVLCGLRVENKLNGQRQDLSLSGVFLAVGQKPQNGFLGDLVAMSPEGYLYSDETALTGTEGIFAAGDCRTKEVRQLTTAAADGAVAALAACAWLDR